MTRPPETPVNEPENGQSSENGVPSKKAEESPLAFLEQLATLFKLRIVKDSTQISNLSQDKLNEIQAKLGGSSEERAEAEASITEIYESVMRADYMTYHKSTTLEDALATANVPEDSGAFDVAESVDMRISFIRGKIEAGDWQDDTIPEEEIRVAIEGLNSLADLTGVDLKVDREKIDLQVRREVGELHRLRDSIQIIRQRQEIGHIGRGIDPENKRNLRDMILDVEDFSDQPRPENRILRVVRGNPQHQAEAEEYIESLRRDFTGDELDRLDEEHLAEGFIRSRLQNRRRLRYGDGMAGIEAADELTMRAGLIYSDRLVDLVVRRRLRGVPQGVGRDMLELQLRSQATMGIMEAWTNRKRDLTTDEVLRIIDLSTTQEYRNEPDGVGEVGATYEDPEDGYYVEDVLDPDGQVMGQRRRRNKRVDTTLQALIAKGVDIESLTRAFVERKRDFDVRGVVGSEHVRTFSAAFDEDLKRMYPGLSLKERQYLSLSAESLFGNEHYQILKERVRTGDYEGYLKYLMSFLYKVGLREGSQDFQLQVMMREARTILANVGRSDLLAIYKSFEKTAVFHEAYFQLDREGYAKILNSWGVEPLQVFKNEEANSLNWEVKNTNGEKINDLGIIKYDDLMQSGNWAHRLIYGDKGEIYNEEKVYDDMLVTLLYGNEENACRIKDGQVINIVTGAAVANLKDRIVVDGREMNLETLIQDGRYMAGIAHDIWRLDGRIANVLDDVQIGAAVGANKELLTTWKIRRYAEEYGFVPTWMLEALSLDNYIYEIENYKDLVGAGMKKLFKGKGVGGEAVAKMINLHLKRRRDLRGEEFRTNYLPVEDVRLLSRASMSWEDSKNEYLRRQKLIGNSIDWDSLNASDKAAYTEQINYLHKKWSTNLFSASERAEINGVDWKSVNQAYAKILGVESIGDTFEDFIKHFSFGRLSATEKFRGTDLKDYGGYFLKSGKVVDIFKGGFSGGATEAIAQIFGTMEGYLPYDSSGLRRFIIKEMEVMYSWDDKKWSVQVPKEEVKKGPNGDLVDGNMDGKRLPNGEMMMDENGYWKSEMSTKMLYGDSLLGKSRMRKSRNERDIEYAVYAMVGSGTIDRETAEEFLDRRYGGIFKRNKYLSRAWRWIKRMAILDDPWILAEVGWEDGKKVAGAMLKQIFAS